MSRTAMKPKNSVPLHFRSSNQPFVFLDTQKVKCKKQKSKAKCLEGLAIKLVIRQLSH